MEMGGIKQMVDDLFQGRDTVSKQEVEQHARQKGMDQNTMQAVQGLPDKQYDKDSLTSMLMEKVGGGTMSGMGGKMGM